MAEPIAKIYTLIGKYGRCIKHRGRPSKKFMEQNPHIKGYKLEYIMNCERITEIYSYKNGKFILIDTKINEWRW